MDNEDFPIVKFREFLDQRSSVTPVGSSNAISPVYELKRSLLDKWQQSFPCPMVTPLHSISCIVPFSRGLSETPHVLRLSDCYSPTHINRRNLGKDYSSSLCVVGESNILRVLIFLFCQLHGDYVRQNSYYRVSLEDEMQNHLKQEDSHLSRRSFSQPCCLPYRMDHQIHK
jgi:hypothetical protein